MCMFQALSFYLFQLGDEERNLVLADHLRGIKQYQISHLADTQVAMAIIKNINIANNKNKCGG